MSQMNQEWLSSLGLTDKDFATMPEGEDALVWGLQQKIIDEEKYLKWASDFYQVPVGNNI